MNDQVDRLIHVLLCEELGGGRMPDVADVVLSRAFPHGGLGVGTAMARAGQIQR